MFSRKAVFFFGLLCLSMPMALQSQDIAYGFRAGTRINLSSIHEPIPKDDYAFLKGRSLHGWEVYGFYRWEWDGWFVEPQVGFFSVEEELYIEQKLPEEKYEFFGLAQQNNISAMISGGAKFSDLFRVYVGLINTLNVGAGVQSATGTGNVDRINMGYNLGVGVDLDTFATIDLVYRGFLLDQEMKLEVGDRFQTVEKNIYFISINIGFFLAWE